MAGYVGYSKSVNAADAEDRGVHNKTQWIKILGFFPEGTRNSEWHHTSKFYNVTPYYSPTDIIKAMNAVQLQKIYDRITKAYYAKEIDEDLLNLAEAIAEDEEFYNKKPNLYVKRLLNRENLRVERLQRRIDNKQNEEGALKNLFYIFENDREREKRIAEEKARAELSHQREIERNNKHIEREKKALEILKLDSRVNEISKNSQRHILEAIKNYLALNINITPEILDKFIIKQIQRQEGKKTLIKV